MTFEFKKQNRIQQEIKLGDEVFTVDLNPAEIQKDWMLAYNNIIRTQMDVQKAKPEEMESSYNKLGEAIYTLLDIYFGDKAEKVSTFFSDNPIEAIGEMIRFTDEIIKPIMEDFAKQQRALASDKYFKDKK